MEKHRTELHFLPIPPPPEPSTSRHRQPPKPPRAPTFYHHHQQQQQQQASFNQHVPDQTPHVPSLDLQLSISLSPFKPPPREPPLGRRIELLRWQAAEQMRLATMERAYAERIRELTRREMDLAQDELARARILWERTKEDVSRVEKIKENSMATNILSPFPQQQVSSSASNSNSCLEITCHSCRRRFRPISETSSRVFRDKGS